MIGTPVRLLMAAALCLGSSVAHAQDLIGFDRSNFGRAVLSDSQFAGVDLELSVGAYNNESIRNYAIDSIFAALGRAVGRLDILTDKGVFPCTAFLISERHILTNYHCVPGVLDSAQVGATAIEAVQFVAGYTLQGVSEGTEIFTVSPKPLEANQDLDYAVLEVFGNPSERFGTLKLSDRVPRPGDPYWIIGHPNGEAQRISREQCRANTPAISGVQLLHTCDTLPGNSGSPVIDAGLQKVAALHHAGSRRDAVNFAIPMALIIEDSQILKTILQGDAAPDETPVSVTPRPTPTPKPDAGSTGSTASSAPSAAPKPTPTPKPAPESPSSGVALAPIPKPSVITVWSGFEVYSPLKFTGIDRPSALAFAPNGRMIVTTDSAGKLTLWSRMVGRSLGTRHEGAHALTAFSMNTQSKAFAVGDANGTVTVYDGDTGKPRHAFRKGTGGVTHLAFDQAGKVVFAAMAGGTIQIWNAETGKHLSTIQMPGAVSDLGVVPTGLTIFALTGDAVMHQLTLRLGDGDWKREVFASGIAALGVNSDTGTLAYADRSGALTVMHKRNPVSETRYTRAQGAPIRDVVLSPDGKSVALVFDGAPPAIFDSGSGQLLFELDVPAEDLAFHPKHPVLAVIENDSDVVIYGAQAP